MTEELKPCDCGNENIEHRCEIGPMASWCYCVCPECGETGPSAPSQEQARAAWNEWKEAEDD